MPKSKYTWPVLTPYPKYIKQSRLIQHMTTMQKANSSSTKANAIKCSPPMNFDEKNRSETNILWDTISELRQTNWRVESDWLLCPFIWWSCVISDNRSNHMPLLDVYNAKKPNMISLHHIVDINCTDSNVHGANMGPTWDLSAPDGPMLAPWNLLSGRMACTFSYDQLSLFTLLGCAQ